MSFESAFEPIFSKKRQGLNEEQFKMQLLHKMNQGFWKKKPSKFNFLETLTNTSSQC